MLFKLNLKRNLRRQLTLLVVGVLTACASLIGPRQMELPLTRLQDNLAHRFPVHQRVLGLFDIELSNPQLTLLAEHNRVAIALEANIASPLTRQSWHGNLALSGRIGFDPVRNAVLVNELSVDRFAIDGMDESRQRQFAAVANVLSDQFIRDMPLHRFHPEDLRFAGVQFVLTSLETRPTGLVVGFAPQ